MIWSRPFYWLSENYFFSSRFISLGIVNLLIVPNILVSLFLFLLFVLIWVWGHVLSCSEVYALSFWFLIYFIFSLSPSHDTRHYTYNRAYWKENWHKYDYGQSEDHHNLIIFFSLPFFLNFLLLCFNKPCTLFITLILILATKFYLQLENILTWHISTTTAALQLASLGILQNHHQKYSYD